MDTLFSHVKEWFFSRHFENNYQFVKADITDRERIIFLFEKEKFDYVVHFAAESHVDCSIT